MTDINLIKQKLPQELREKAEKFTIPDEFIITMPDLIILVLNSKSMDAAEEKQSRFNLLPMMNKDQIDKLTKVADIVNKKLIVLLAIDGGVGAYAVRFIEQNNVFGYVLGIIFIVAGSFLFLLPVFQKRSKHST